ncbi:hypothetical protein GW17_00043815 [Ensete ventricosum]|nr:hypothetical protein GW17_00043815 [Ensete ventricosum]
MGKRSRKLVSKILGRVWRLFRRWFFLMLSFGPMPEHIAFILDGNRRYAKKKKLKMGAGHNVGFNSLVAVLRYCYELGVKYVTVYAFSIDNFKRKPEEVQGLMALMKEKIDELLEEEDTIVHKFGLRIDFWGRLDLLSESARLAAERAMAATASNTGPVLCVCVAYTSTDEIARAIKKSCSKKREEEAAGARGSIAVADLEKNFDSAHCPDPDILIRTSGETRLSNFLLWQSAMTHLQNPRPLWPEFSLRNLIWAILKYQKAHPYLEARRRRLAKKQN